MRVNCDLDDVGLGQLRTILDDLVDDHHAIDIIIDLSEATTIEEGLRTILDSVQLRVETAGGRLELRAPHRPPDDIIEIADGIPTFAPLCPRLI